MEAKATIKSFREGETCNYYLHSMCCEKANRATEVEKKIRYFPFREKEYLNWKNNK